MNIQYIRSGDYFIPDLKLTEETRPIGKWGRMHRDYLKEHHPIQFNNLVLSGNLWTYLADLNEQAQQRMETLIVQLKASEGITEELKAADPEADLELYRAAQAEMRSLLGGAKLPKMDVLKEEGRKLTAKKKQLYGEYQKARRDMQEIVTIKANIDTLMGYTEPGRKQEKGR